MLARRLAAATVTASTALIPTRVFRRPADLRGDPGHERLGDHIVLHKLGSGGAADVFLAVHEPTGNEVAIKRARTGDVAPGSPAAIDREHRLRLEARVLTEIDHPNVVRLLDVGTAGDGTTYLVIEYLHGPTLRDLVHEHGPLDVDTTLRLAIAIVRGLGAAHTSGFVHCDLKARNVIVVPGAATDEVVKLIDFGIATRDIKRCDTAPYDTVRAPSRPGAAAGTPTFMSPEHLRGDDVDERSDIYSFGVLLYYMLTRGFPSEATQLDAIAHDELRSIVARCLRPAPHDRYRSAEDLRLALEQAHALRCVAQVAGATEVAQVAGAADVAPAGEPSPRASLPPEAPAPVFLLGAPNAPAPDQAPASPRAATVRAATARAATLPAPPPYVRRRRTVLVLGAAVLCGACLALALPMERDAAPGTTPAPATQPAEDRAPVAPGAPADPASEPASAGAADLASVPASASLPRPPATLDPGSRGAEPIPAASDPASRTNRDRRRSTRDRASPKRGSADHVRDDDGPRLGAADAGAGAPSVRSAGGRDVADPEPPEASAPRGSSPRPPRPRPYEQVVF